MDRRTALLVAAAVLLALGVVLVAITEPAGEEGEQASGGVADVSEETRPYLWPGLGCIAAGLVLVVVGLTGTRKPKAR